MGEPKKLVPVIVGPTAVGKTAVAMALGEHWSITVISADSRQVYRTLDLGTAKPTAAELRLVPHLGIDVVDPGEAYSAGRFAADGTRWINDVPEERRPVVVGGTGFYVRALADGLFREPPMNRARRDELRRWTSTAQGLGRMAARLDGGYRGGGRQRAARAVEVALLTGRPLSWWQRQAREDGVMRPWYVLLRVPRPVLHERIERRVSWMLQAGLIEEVESVLAGGVAPTAPGLDAVGYREIIDYLAGRLSRLDLAEKIITSTRQYAKRQETWFKHQLHDDPVLVLDATRSAQAVAGTIRDAWAARMEQCASA